MRAPPAHPTNMSETTPSFAELGLLPSVLAAVHDVGYETPTAIQAPTIAHLLAGRDVVGQAQTGTGKTAAFALPLLSRLDLTRAEAQVLVLTPTRELAIQVAEAFQTYASHLRGFHVLPIYGGQDYAVQLRQLKRGAHVIVGTPGRLMDHMRRGSLQLARIATVVLDEADEMLRMGFIEDVEWILAQAPPVRQVALFSATMPNEIRRIAQQYLKDPAEITIRTRTTTAETIRQRYWIVTGLHKLDALTRLLETEPFDAVLIFVRTRTATVELADRLAARGYATAALNGDMPQKLREQTVGRLKSGKLDILVATDVAARGLDVERISLVVNFDIPNDSEAYVHRIGRTGRAGRCGEAILFVAPRERHLLRAIERTTRQRIEPMELPSAEAVNDKRIAAFMQRITDTIATRDLEFFRDLVTRYEQQHGRDARDIAAALAQIAQGDKPLLVKEDVRSRGVDAVERTRAAKRSSHIEHELFRVEVGSSHGAEARNLVGAIANEAGLASENIGRIEIFDEHSTIELPTGMPKDIFAMLKKVWVAGRQLNISRLRKVPRQRLQSDRKPRKMPRKSSGKANGGKS
jgi:ATP-dependent RNA helicase DeaD